MLRSFVAPAEASGTNADSDNAATVASSRNFRICLISVSRSDAGGQQHAVDDVDQPI